MAMQKGYIRTFSGQSIYPVGDHAQNKTLEKIKLVDVAHHLSQINRYTGACKFPYSVGIHSLACLELARRRGLYYSAQMAALMHDGSEAYLTDLAAPIKDLPEFEPYRKHEAELQDLVDGKFLGPHVFMLSKLWFREAIKEIDRDMFCAEWPVLMGEPEEGIPDAPQDAKEALQEILSPKITAGQVRDLFYHWAQFLASKLKISTSDW